MFKNKKKPPKANKNCSYGCRTVSWRCLLMIREGNNKSTSTSTTVVSNNAN